MKHLCNLVLEKSLFIKVLASLFREKHNKQTKKHIVSVKC